MGKSSTTTTKKRVTVSDLKRAIDQLATAIDHVSRRDQAQETLLAGLAGLVRQMMPTLPSNAQKPAREFLAAYEAHYAPAPDGNGAEAA